MNATHTPGPWTIERPYAEPGLFVSAADPRRTNPLICRVITDLDADARLIAAAPLLLEALTRVVAGAGYTSGYADTGTLRKNGMGLNVPILFLDEARAAIAKATGGT